jgi:hypothetical protein
MANQKQTLARSEQDKAEKIRQLPELLADAPRLGKTALENALRLMSQVSETPPLPAAFTSMR